MEVEMDVFSFEVCLNDDIVTYVDWYNWELALFEMDLKTEEKTKLLTLDNVTEELDRHGDIIVWADERNDPDHEDFDDYHDIYLFDVANMVEAQITTNDQNQEKPVIHGNIIVWVDERNGNKDIYAYDITTDADSNGVADYLDWGRHVERTDDGDDGDDDDQMVEMIVLVGCSISFIVIVVVISMLVGRKSKSRPLPPDAFSEIPYQAHYQPPPAQMGQTSMLPMSSPPQSMPPQMGTVPPPTSPSFSKPTDPQTQQSYQPSPSSQHLCTSCNQPARHVPEYNRNFCDRCQRYL